MPSGVSAHHGNTAPASILPVKFRFIIEYFLTPDDQILQSTWNVFQAFTLLHNEAVFVNVTVRIMIAAQYLICFL